MSIHLIGMALYFTRPFWFAATHHLVEQQNWKELYTKEEVAWALLWRHQPSLQVNINPNIFCSWQWS